MAGTAIPEPPRPGELAEREEVVAAEVEVLAPREGAWSQTPWAAEGAAEKATHITLRRDPDTSIGLNLEALDVCNIIPGSIQEWNDSHPESERLLVHDRIIAVNGLSGDFEKIITTLMATTEWKLTVSRPMELHVSLGDVGFPNLGLDLRQAANSSTLLISGVGEGAIQEWNSKSQGPKVRQHDRIMSINGVTGRARSLLEAASDAEDLELTILHYEHSSC